VELGRSVVVATSFHGLWCGGPHWEGNTPEGRGIKPAYWATMSPKDRQDLMDDQDRRERRRVPRVLEPFFDGILVLRRAFHAEYAQSTAWPTEHRMATGSYPTWGEMAERWPVLGAHLRRVWEPAAKAA